MISGPFPGLMVLLINLDRSVERRQTMEARLAALELPYQRLSAVDGKVRWAELASSVNLELFQRNVGRDLMPGEVGCYHSHLQAWEQLLDSECHTLLALEDDVVFGTDFMGALQLALEHRDAWDTLNLNKIRAKQPVPQQRMGAYTLNAYLGPLTGMGAYLISRQAAAHLLPNMLPISLPIDLELDRVHCHDLRRFGCEPFPSHVDDGSNSTITGQAFSGVNKYPWYQRMPAYKRRIINLIRKLVYLKSAGRIFPKLTEDQSSDRSA